MDWWIGGLPRMARGSLCLTRSLLKFAYLACGTSPEAAWKVENEKETRKERERKEGNPQCSSSVSLSLPPSLHLHRVLGVDDSITSSSVTLSSSLSGLSPQVPSFRACFLWSCSATPLQLPSSSGTLVRKLRVGVRWAPLPRLIPFISGYQIDVKRLAVINCILPSWSKETPHNVLSIPEPLLALHRHGYQHVRVSIKLATVYPPYYCIDIWLYSAWFNTC